MGALRGQPGAHPGQALLHPAIEAKRVLDQTASRWGGFKSPARIGAKYSSRFYGCAAFWDDDISIALSASHGCRLGRLQWQYFFTAEWRRLHGQRISGVREHGRRLDKHVNASAFGSS